MSELTAALATIEKCREITGCPAGVDLQDWVKRLAAENVALRETIDAVRGVADSSSGIAGYHLNGDIAKWSDILPEIDAIETPATDGCLAGIKADGVEGFIGRLQQHVDDGDFMGDEVAVIVGAIDCGKEFCEQLREGTK